MSEKEFYVKNEKGEFEYIGKEYPISISDGCHIVYVQKGRRSTIHKVNPNYAGLFAVLMEFEDEIVNDIMEIVAQNPSPSITPKQLEKIKKIIPNIFTIATREGGLTMCRRLMERIIGKCSENDIFEPLS